MTAPMSLREYFAAAGSAFTKQEAEVIGPQITAMAEDGALVTSDDETAKRVIVDTARSANSPLHQFFIWDDAKAADVQRLDHAGKMLRAIRVRYIEDDRPRTTSAYRIARPQQKAVFARGHNVLHGESAAAVQKAKEAFDELTSWRARYQPYVIVWKDFAQAFRGVSNQIGEAEDVVRAQTLNDATDRALTDMLAIQALCRAWQLAHGEAQSTWFTLSEQAGFMVEAIDDACVTFNRDKPAERNCMKCRKPFQSGGVGNRLCERCSTVSLQEHAKLA